MSNNIPCRPCVVFIGKLPPPYIGPTMATKILLESELRNRYNIIHLDVSDHRSADTLGKLDLYNIWMAVRQYAVLFWMLIKYDVDILYFPSAQTTIAYLRDIPNIIIAKIFSVKIVMHLRGGNFDKWLASTSYYVKSTVRYFHRKIDAQIVLGDCLRYMYDNLIDEKKIFVVPNGMNYSYANKSDKSSVKKQVLFLGNYIGSKGILEYAEAASIISKLREDVQFIAVGAFRDKGIKEKLLDIERTANGRIKIIGGLQGKEKYDVIASSHIFVFPTYYHNEGHPWVIVEAIAAGLPVISTDKGAIKESVIHGYNGFIAEKRSVDDIKKYITILLDDDALRTTMGERSLELYRSKYTLDHLVDNISYVFDSVLKMK